MLINQKLTKLRRLDDLVLYRWSAGQRRIAGNFILLTDLRLNVLSCSGGKVRFSIAAPLLLMVNGRPVIQFRDKDVMTVLEGNRKGINITAAMLHEGEQAAMARHCSTRVVDDDNCPKWLADKIIAMATTPCYPVTCLRLPELFRISKKPQTLKPIITAELLRDIKGEKTDSTETILKKFHDNLELFGYFTEEGYVISYDRIISGGCCVVASNGINARSGSAVHMMTLTAFQSELEKRHWDITVKEAENDLAGVGALSQ